jgi:hypothetical protein
MPRQEPPEPTVKEVAAMYRMGYRQGMTELYSDNNTTNMRYGLQHYGRQGEMKDGAYERGVADALYDRLEAADHA